MTIDEQINKIIETAKSTGGKIELYVKTDVCDADYSIATFQYTVNEFIEYEIADIYRFLRTMADDWKSVKNMGHCAARHEIEEAHRQTIENRWDGKDAIADRYKDVYVDGFGEYLAYGIEPYEPHTVAEAKLRVIVEEV